MTAAQDRLTPRSPAPDSGLHAVAPLFQSEAEPLLLAWRHKMTGWPGAQHLDVPTLERQVSALVPVLTAAVEQDADDEVAAVIPSAGLPADHDIGDLVAACGAFRECLLERIEALPVPAQRDVARRINRLLDRTIAQSVATHARQQKERVSFLVHDLRTPLNAMTVAVDVLECNTPSPRDGHLAQRMLNNLRRNLALLKALIARELEAYRPLPAIEAPGVHDAFKLRLLTDALAQELDPMARAAGVQLINAVPEALLMRADPSVIGRVLQNLIANAIDHARGGTVLIGAEATDAGTVACWVRDNGSGISAARIADVFSQDSSDRRDRHGCGLGLAIVKQLLESQGGRIQVESEEGRGSTFRFELAARTPRARDPS